MSCRGLIKTIMFFVNFILSLIGLGIFIIGILGFVYVEKISSTYPELPVPSFFATFVAIIGAIVFLISFSGCCGAIKEINCLLGLYTIVMFLLAAAKIALAVYVITQKETIMKSANDSVSKIDINNAKDAATLHLIEYVAKCCGTTGPGSYVAANATIPQTCCPLGPEEICNEKAAAIFEKGCQTTATSWIVNYVDTAIYSLFGIAVFELLSMITAMYLICYRKKGDYYEYD